MKSSASPAPLARRPPSSSARERWASKAVEELQQAVDPLVEDATLTSLVGADPVVRSVF